MSYYNTGKLPANITVIFCSIRVFSSSLHFSPIKGKKMHFFKKFGLEQNHPGAGGLAACFQPEGCSDAPHYGWHSSLCPASSSCKISAGNRSIISCRALLHANTTCNTPGKVLKAFSWEVSAQLWFLMVYLIFFLFFFPKTKRAAPALSSPALSFPHCSVASSSAPLRACRVTQQGTEMG